MISLLNSEGAPNYFPNSFTGPDAAAVHKEHRFSTVGDCDRYNSADEDNYTQVGIFWKEVSEVSVIYGNIWPF